MARGVDAALLISLGKAAPEKACDPEVGPGWRDEACAAAVTCQVEKFCEDEAVLRLQFALKEALMALPHAHAGTRAQLARACQGLASALFLTLHALGISTANPPPRNFGGEAKPPRYNPGVD